MSPGTKVSWGKLNRYMKKAGVPQFDFQTFQAAYDASPQLQNLVEFSPEGIEIIDSADQNDLNTDEPENDGSKSTVSSMAKSAVDLNDL